ncbi:hypothetical protein EH240_01190 [Mesorhizobium tamadayense]|uniref:DUF680 domain-containing protein n=1 Tax=Mesorhizobium tamadayense TaxID=425306 RepID=A0A3P3GAJ7_9HYPH|nr:hypothetical protein [Mesorhizobium tamadayense]RRI07881.1 hypothetical protein EH240_01190 [Mesorhizobium tamadayense]
MKIILATVALLSASGMAFTASDNYGSGYVPGTDAYPSTGGHSMASDNAYSLDLGNTNNIGMARSESAASGNSAFDIPAAGYGQGIWGR